MKLIIIITSILLLIGCSKHSDLCVCKTAYNGNVKKVFIVKGRNMNDTKQHCLESGSDCGNERIEKHVFCQLK